MANPPSAGWGDGGSEPLAHPGLGALGSPSGVQLCSDLLRGLPSRPRSLSQKNKQKNASAMLGIQRAKELCFWEETSFFLFISALPHPPPSRVQFEPSDQQASGPCKQPLPSGRWGRRRCSQPTSTWPAGLQRREDIFKPPESCSHSFWKISGFCRSFYPNIPELCSPGDQRPSHDRTFAWG